MGWGSIIKEVVLYRVYPKDIADKLKETEEMIEFLKDDIKALVHATPRDIVEADGSITHWEDYAKFKLRDTLEELEDEIWKKHLCQCALDCPEDVEEY